jgi:hypothetical protein
LALKDLDISPLQERRSLSSNFDGLFNLTENSTLALKESNISL